MKMMSIKGTNIPVAIHNSREEELAAAAAHAIEDANKSKEDKEWKVQIVNDLFYAMNILEMVPDIKFAFCSDSITYALPLLQNTQSD